MGARQPDTVAIGQRRVPRGLLAVLVVGAIVLAGIARPLVGEVPPPAGVSAQEWAFCTDSKRTGPLIGGSSGPGLVDSVGRTYLGWEGERQEEWEEKDMPGADMARQPGVATACRIAFELYGLEEAEWDWCNRNWRAHVPEEYWLHPSSAPDQGTAEEPNAALLVAAVAMLGMGEDEATKSDGLYEFIPGDDLAEFTQACRLAYRYWREDGRASPIADPRSHPFFALTPAQQDWCGAAENRGVLDRTARQLGIETPDDAPFIEQLTAYIRSCRLASIAGRIPANVPTVHVLDELQVFSPQVRERAEAQLAEIKRSTGFVGVLVTELTTGGNSLGRGSPPNTGPEVSGFIEVRYAADDPHCCATLYAAREPMRFEECCDASLDPVASLFAGGRSDEALRAFVSLVEDLAGGPEPSPRRLPDDPFAET